MLTIRPDQFEGIRQYHLQKFEDEMVEHSKEFSPPLCKALGDEQLRVALRTAMKRANGYGFTNRGPLRLFIEIMFLCGSGFDTDPQYCVIGDVLRLKADQMLRADLLFAIVVEYVEKVSGLGAVNVHQALRNLLTARQRTLFPPENLTDSLLAGMAQAFPQKAAYLSEKPLRELIAEAFKEAERYQFFQASQKGLIVALMFTFGHGCKNDPLYPWISKTLSDDKIRNADARAARLEKKAITWLEHVVAVNEQEAQA